MAPKPKFADKIIDFNQSLNFTGTLPPGIRIMNPFRENPEILPVCAAFYQKYFSHSEKRHAIFGINPGRFGGGVTGVPFTDPKRLKSECNLEYYGKELHEPSSVFVYEVIKAFGGPEAFYQHFYINSICPLGFTALGKNGKEVNYNYYDSPALTAVVKDFIVENLYKQIEMGLYTDICYCFGTGKNEKFFRQLNQKHSFFKEIIALEHPRFIMQYKSKSKKFYLDKYLAAFDLAIASE